MKKIFYLSIIMIFILSLNLTCYGFEIMRSPQQVMVDGVKTDFEVYNIDGNNYFKLRDIAYVLKQTKARFSVDYDETEKMIKVLTDEFYYPVGGEMQKGEDKSSTAVLSNQKIKVNGILRDLTAYNIGGNNFFKLRDLGQALGFEVTYEAETNTVMINSEYELEKINLFNYVGEYVDDVNKNIRIYVNESDSLEIMMSTYEGYRTTTLKQDISGNWYYYDNSFSEEELINVSFKDGFLDLISSSTDENDILNDMTGRYNKVEYEAKGWSGVYQKDNINIIISEISNNYMQIYIEKDYSIKGLYIQEFNTEKAIKEEEWFGETEKIQITKTKSGLIIKASASETDDLLNEVNGEYIKIK